MKVREAMSTTISCAAPRDTIQHVAEIMKKDDTGFVPVVEGEVLLGAVTDRDIVVRCLAVGHQDPMHETVEHVMSRDVQTISPDDDLETAGRTMATQEIRRLAVIENGNLVGVLSHGNLVQATRGSGAAQDATVGVTEGA
jgi:CBS domain-containing protein